MNAEHMTSLVWGASTVQSVGTVIVALLLTGFVIYLVFNLRAGRREVGSEIELAPNRKPYLGDEQLETTKLNRTLAAGLGMLLIVAVGLPLYWLHEPGRQEGAVENFEETFIQRGEEQFNEGSDCASCHGPEGSGGVATYTLLDDAGDFVATVGWLAPALDTAALRFSREELAYIIEYGRPGTPMVGWGAGGNGPRTEQQIDNIIDYLFSIARDPEEVRQEVEEQLASDLGVEPGEIDYMNDPRVGEALFNMDSALGSGAFACARCHTQGWSIQTDNIEPPEPVRPIPDFVDSEPGSGAFGPPLRDMVPRKFASADALAEFVSTGSVDGEGYGRRDIGTGNMPGFGDDPNTEALDDGMYTREMVCSVALYVSSLGPEGEVGPAPEIGETEDAFCSAASIAATGQSDEAEGSE